MYKADALILLVKSLSKVEKRNFTSSSKDSDYRLLFDLINKTKTITREELKKLFLEKRSTGNFDVAVSYLYELLLDSLLSLRKQQDDHYILLNMLLKARVLFEKCLFEEALDALNQVKALAEEKENYLVYLYAARLEMEYLLSLDFSNITEDELTSKQYLISDKLNTIRQINQHSSLFELMKHRIIHQEKIRSAEQRNRFNDLVISEMSIIRSSRGNSFELQKQHLLFHSSYLLHVGDYESALHSFYELNDLFEKHKHLWTNPPVYYVMVIEGILNSLRSINKYDEMGHFINRLKKLKDYSQIHFQAEVAALIFLYGLFPLLDKGYFRESLTYIKRQDVFDKIHLLNLSRHAEICLYQSLAYFGNKEWLKARKMLSHIIVREKSYYSLPLYRSIRLINMMVGYKMRDFESIVYETRSIRREVSKNDKTYRTEKLMLQFLNLPQISSIAYRRRTEKKILEELEHVRNDNFERQILKLFDFTAFMESELRRIPLSVVLADRQAE